MNFIYKKSGQVIILVALLLVVLLGVVGLMIDVGNLYVQRSIIRNACDAIALASSKELPNSSTATLTAQQYANLNRISPQEITIITPYNGDSNKIGIVISRSVPFYFMRVFGYTSSPVRTKCVGTKLAAGKNNLIPIAVPDTATTTCRLWGPNNQCNDVSPSGGGGPLGAQYKGLTDLGCCDETAEINPDPDCQPYDPATNYGNKPKNIEGWILNGCDCEIYTGNDLCAYSGDLGSNMGTPLKNRCNAQGLSDAGGAYGLFTAVIYNKILPNNRVNVSGYGVYKIYCNNISSSSASGTFIEFLPNLPPDTLIPAHELSAGLIE